MTSTTDIATALRTQLPVELHGCIEPLAAVIAELRAGRLSHAEAQEQLRSQVLAPLRDYCTRQPLTIRDQGSGTILGGDLIIVGDISQAKGVAIGPNAKAEVFELNLSFTSSSRSPSSILALARSRHSLERYADLRKGFVGRGDELSEIRKLLTELQPAGGYLLVTGIAGQGKSSVLAALIAELGSETTPAFFIRFSPGADEQVALLRHLVAELLMIHALEELTEGLLPETAGTITLANSLTLMLDRISREGEHVVLVIDGLDQIKPSREMGERDLSFLPEKLPPGVVIVIGSRPDDTLKPLKVLASQREYKLPPLSPDDFVALLEAQEAVLVEHDRQRLYDALHGNAYDLAFVAGEIQRTPDAQVESLLQRVIANPFDIFAPALDRLRVDRALWKSAVRPILGCLLAATESEPLSEDALGAILSLDTDEVSDGLQRLCGLLGVNDRGGKALYYLQHLKLIEYLRGGQPGIGGQIFSSHDVERYHQDLANWCARTQSDLPVIWQDALGDTVEQERRAYARQYYVTHLAAARAYEQLWEVIDRGEYGQMKQHWDPSARSYVLDLDIARKAVVDTVKDDTKGQILCLPRLWRYSLLRCLLNSRADRYPEELFPILVALGRSNEAINLAELQTNAEKKANILLEIGVAMIAQSSPKGVAVLRRSWQVVEAIPNAFSRAKACNALIIAFTQARQWAEVRKLVETIADPSSHAKALCALAAALVQAKELDVAMLAFQQTLQIAESIADTSLREEILGILVKNLTYAEHWEEAIQVAKTIVKSPFRAWALETLVASLLQDKQWKEARQMAEAIEDSSSRARVLGSLAESLAQAGHWAEARRVAEAIVIAPLRAKTLGTLAVAFTRFGQSETAMMLFQQSHQVASTIVNPYLRGETLGALVAALAKAGQWTEAYQMAEVIADIPLRTSALGVLAVALVQDGQREAAMTAFQQARQVAENIASSYERERALKDLAAALTQAQQWAEARQVAESIASSYEREQALKDLAAALTQAQQWAEARQVAESIASSYERERALKDLAAALTQAQQWAEARQVIEAIEDSSSRAKALKDLAAALAQTRLWAEARHIAEAIVDAASRTSALGVLAVALVQDGQREAAMTAFQQARQVAENIASSYEREQALKDLAAALTQAQQWAEARQIAESIASSYEREQALKDLAAALTQAQQWAEARQVANNIGNSSSQVEALSALGVALNQTAQLEDSVTTLQQVRQMAETIEDPSSRAKALSTVALASMEAGQQEAAITTIQQARQVAEDIEDTSSHAHTLIVLAIAMNQTGQLDAARLTLEEARRVMENISFDDIYVRSLSNLATAFARIGQIETAMVTFRRASQVLKAAGHDPDHSDPTIPLGSLVDELVRRGQWAEARQVAEGITDYAMRKSALMILVVTLIQSGQWVEARQVAESIGDSSAQVEALSALGVALNQTAQPEDSVMTLQQARQMAEVIENPSSRAEALSTLSIALAQTGQFSKLLDLIQQSWLGEMSSDVLFKLAKLAVPIIAHYPEHVTGSTVFGKFFLGQ